MNHTKIIFAFALLILFLFSTASAITSTCTDSDGGMNNNIKGAIKGIGYDGNTYEKTDSCEKRTLSDGSVASFFEEFYCRDTNISCVEAGLEGPYCRNAGFCDAGYECYDGACVDKNEMPKSCQDLNKAITDAWQTSCGNSKYSRVADITNDGNVDVYDLSKFADNAYDEKWCTDQAKDDTDPCKKAASYGKIKVTSSPSKADVYLDGRYAGITPLGLSEVSVGTHTIEVKLANYNPYKKVIKISKNRTTPVNAKLKKISTKKSTKSTKKSTKTTGAATAAATIAASKTKEYGKIKVTSSPSKADIYIDDKQVGKTPYTSGKLAKGTYSVAVKKEGYKDYKTKAKVVANKTTPVHAKLKELRTFCKDTDEGLDYEKAGMVSGRESGKKFKNRDTCITSDLLQEFYCTSTEEPSAKEYTCPSGCKNGACKESTGEIIREFITAPMNNKTNTAEYMENIGNPYFTTFKNGSITIKHGLDTYSVTETETVGVKIDAGFDTANTNVKDLVAYIYNGDLNYVADFSTGVVECGYIDEGSAYYAPISFLGKPYIIEQVDADCARVELVANNENAEKKLKLGDTIDVDGRVAGTKYKFKIVSGYIRSDDTYQAQIELQDASGNKLQSQYFTASATSPITFYDSTGNNLISTKVLLKAISKDVGTNIWTFTFMIGTDSITIKNGQRFPYDPNNTSGTYFWVGTVTKDSRGLMVAKISVKNQAKLWDANNPLYSKTYSVNSAGNSEAGILEGSGLDTLGSIEFKGFYDSSVQKTTVKFLASGANVTGQATPYGNLDYYDASSVHHMIPYAMKLSSVGYGSGTFVFEGQTYNFRAGKTSAANVAESSISSGDGNFWFKTGSTIGSGTSLEMGDGNYTIDTGTGNVWNNPGDVDANVLGRPLVRSQTTGGYSPMVQLTSNKPRYIYALKATPSGLWLVLAGQDNNAVYGMIDNLQYNAGTLWLLGTDKDDAKGISTLGSDASGTVGSILPYYVPDTVEFGANPGSTSGVFKTAVFKIKPITIGTIIPDYSNPANYLGYTIYVDTSDHKIVDTANISKTNYTGKLTGIDYNSDLGGTRDYNINHLSEYTGSSSNYTKAYDSNGVYMQLSNRELTMTIPNGMMRTYVVVKSNQ